jgi:hypothetical protein
VSILVRSAARARARALRHVILQQSLPAPIGGITASVLHPAKCSSAKSAPSVISSSAVISSSSKCAPSIWSSNETASSEIDLSRANGVVRAQISPAPRNLSAHVAEQRIDPVMIALDCRVGSVHLKQAGNDFRCQNAHGHPPNPAMMIDDTKNTAGCQLTRERRERGLRALQ